MQLYEIRILRNNGATQAVVKQMFINDFAAIRTAQQWADERLFEVWRDLECLYTLKPTIGGRASGTPPTRAAS